MCSTNRLGSGFAQAEEPHLPCLHQLSHRADSVFDWNVRIDPVLIVKINTFDP